MSYQRTFNMILVGNLVLCATGCKEDGQNYHADHPQSDSDIERFGFDEKPTLSPTPKVVIPFDNERTRQDAKTL